MWIWLNGRYRRHSEKKFRDCTFRIGFMILSKSLSIGIQYKQSLRLLCLGIVWEFRILLSYFSVVRKSCVYYSMTRRKKWGCITRSTVNNIQRVSNHESQMAETDGKSKGYRLGEFLPWRKLSWTRYKSDTPTEGFP